jgi:hypothetical protein
MASTQSLGLVVLDPTVGEQIRATTPAPRLASLEGKRVGLMTNHKPMADVFLVYLGDLLKERYGVEWELIDKLDPSRVASRGILDSMAAKNHAIITGVGD